MLSTFTATVIVCHAACSQHPQPAPNTLLLSVLTSQEDRSSFMLIVVRLYILALLHKLVTKGAALSERRGVAYGDPTHGA
jgi:hypothetical protein